ncbi:MAG: phosphoenolpyruvate--protein phosphotransferase [Planctomycetota bacterium]|nr:MAG: phosphoenolpyruvate--protein phosphotransferase [Planctomycetota bacterium]
MKILHGIGVSRGVAIAPAVVLGKRAFRVPARFVNVKAVDSAIERLETAVDAVCAEIAESERMAAKQLGEKYSTIFHAHQQMLRDPKLLEEMKQLIREKCYAPEYAASQVFRRYIKVFQNLGTAYLAERAMDLEDLERRLVRQLLGKQRLDLSHFTQDVVVLANDLTPGETADLDRQHVKGFATEAGGPTSHTAILAGALEIPAVVGIGPFLNDVQAGETVIVDGTQGVVIVAPDEPTLERYRMRSRQLAMLRQRRRQLRTRPAVTRDGVRIRLKANIEFPDEIDHCLEHGAEGVGLFRTEFLYLRDEQEPTEEEHFEAYRRVVEAFGDKPVTIRTLDLGADKVSQRIRERERPPANPALGLRSLRLSLKYLDLFKTQLRAILRVARLGNVQVMFPLVTTVQEFRQARLVLNEVAEDLSHDGIDHDRKIPIGMMVEVPAAAIMAERFAREAGFFSIGTNDLIQYTLAADRGDKEVAHLYRAGEPAVMRLLRMTTAAARKHGIPVAVCGQMASQLPFVPVLIGMGVRELSVPPQVIPELKDLIGKLDTRECANLSKAIARFESGNTVEQHLVRVVRSCMENDLEEA